MCSLAPILLVHLCCHCSLLGSSVMMLWPRVFLLSPELDRREASSPVTSLDQMSQWPNAMPLSRSLLRPSLSKRGEEDEITFILFMVGLWTELHSSMTMVSVQQTSARTAT